MTPTPTPAPALTGEQIVPEMTDAAVRASFSYAQLAVRGHETSEIGTALSVAISEAFDTWYADVAARAKREERERIADDIQTRATALLSSLDAMPEEKRQGGHMFVLNTIACANIARKEPEARHA